MLRSRCCALLIILAVGLTQAQTVSRYEGISAVHDPHAEKDVDPNGAVGTMQYMEWVDVAYQAWDKTPPYKKVYDNPMPGSTPWKIANLTSCENIGGDGIILFDRLASRWVIAAHSTKDANGDFYYCIAVSNTDNLRASNFQWYAYEFSLTSALGGPYFPDWPKLGTWPDAYYAGIDILNPAKSWGFVGVLACALDRTNILTGATNPRPMQCVRYKQANPYQWHSLIPSDVDGTTAPPSGQDAYFVSIQNPVRNGKSTTSTSINLWDFQLDTSWSGKSKLVRSSLTVPSYTPACYTAQQPTKVNCVPQPKGNEHLASLGDRLMPRLAYRNFGTYQSWLVSQAVQVADTRQSGIRWYEMRGSGTPTLYQSGTVSIDTTAYRFMPSMAQDSAGNAAVGYSVSSGTVLPGIRASTWSLVNNSSPVEVNIQNGLGVQENTTDWGDYTSMTVDPTDDCTFWYVNEYMPADQKGKQIIWHTKIANFSLSSCQ